MAEISTLRINACRKAANDVLASFDVQSPDEIDLETIAWRMGRLRIRYGGLQGCDGRIIAGPEGGIIRVRRSPSLGRERFTIGHEMGHFALHPSPQIDREDGPPQFAMWHSDDEEVEANMFSAELLMPEFLVVRQIRDKEPSIALLDSLSEKFSTSLLASAMQYTKYTDEQVALVLIERRTILWAKLSKNFGYRIRRGTVSRDSAAGERLDGKAPDPDKMVVTPACAWLSEFEYDNKHDIMEDSRYLDYYDRTISLLWLNEDLEELETGRYRARTYPITSLTTSPQS